MRRLLTILSICVLCFTAQAQIVTGVSRTGEVGTAGEDLPFVGEKGQIESTPRLASTGELLDVLMVTTAPISDTAYYTATSGGEVKSNGSTGVTARGVCWSTSPNPTINDAHTSDGNTTGIFTSGLTRLASATLYHVRAYATDATGTYYGQDISFTTKKFYCPSITANANESVFKTGIDSVTDHEGNKYPVVGIGSQCWMSANMRATTSPTTGTNLMVANLNGNVSVVGKQARWKDNDPVTNGWQGIYYNWNAALDTFQASHTETEVLHDDVLCVGANFTNVNRRGICPEGWHVPHVAEYQALHDYVAANYPCGTNATAKALISQTHWTSNSNNCNVGNSETNNATGFNAVPAGWHGSDNYNYVGGAVLFWAADFWDDSYHRYTRKYTWLIYGSNLQNNQPLWIHQGIPIRCLRDIPIGQ
ncbi:MAG: fibrobacter succinogenes major paralogous domain-containing protein [Bacteroidales bacterium]|nr:fibrobacter succinogenes major paralogous domain-containing protein [Bacteroidales bacterium]